MSECLTRRRTLRGVGVALVAGVAGCSGDDGATTSPGSDDETPGAGDGDDSGDRPTVTDRNPRALDASGAWPQAGGDPGHTGVTDANGVPNDGAVYWQRRRVRSGPAVLRDGRLFHYARLGADASGRATITRTREPDAGTAHPVYGEPHLVARDAVDGSLQWSAPLPSESRGWPAVASGRVLSAVSGRIAAHETATGDALWTEDIGEKDVGTPVVTEGTAVVPVQGVVDGDTYVQRPAIRAFDVADGSEQWSVEPPKRGNYLVVSGDTVVVVSADFDERAVVLGLSRSTGEERWRETVPGGFFDLPVAAGGQVFLTNQTNTVRALSASDGSEVWAERVGGQPVRVAADGESVYVAVGSRVLALAHGSGDEQWSVTAGSRSEYASAVAVGADTVYAGWEGVEAPLTAFDRSDGAERWSHTFPNKTVEGDIVRSGVAAQPVVADGGLYVFAVDGLYAFGPA
ncbi:MAG: PQQ-binding-like beta-propeller repeat protein [Haloarculaceae archaeon]